VFFTELIPEWEKEIASNLTSLNQLLSPKDRQALAREQQGWEAARRRAKPKPAKRIRQEGTMYLALGAADAVSIPEARALELACRVERLSPK
jgi:hypothetical protein